MYGVIYKITNTVNGKFYIGQTIMRLENRWGKHKSDAKTGAGWVLASAIRKYGADAFIIEVVEEHECKDSLNAAEIRLIADLRPDYNSCAGGGGLGSPIPEVREKISRTTKGRKKSEETRSKMSQAQIGKVLSPETVAKIQKALQPYYQQLTANRIEKYGTSDKALAAKIRQKANTPKYVSPLQEYYDAIGANTRNEKIAAAAKLGYQAGSRKILAGVANPMYGKTKPDEIKEKLSQEMRGAGNPYYGKKHSDEIKAKMKAAHASRPSVVCPHCNKSGRVNTMKRWHFDNCRSKI